MPEVSVVIPAYNAEHTLGQTLASALSQTLEDIEVIVVDDGSTDATAAVARAGGDSRVRVLSVPNGGVARARNLGMKEASADLVAFLDADDLWEGRKLERQAEALEAHPDAGISCTAALRIGADGEPLAPMPLEDHHDYTAAILLHSMVAGCISSGTVRRALALELGGFDPSFSQSADWDFWLRLSLVTSFAPVAEPLVRYRTYAGNMSSDVTLLERDTFAVLDKFFADSASAPYRAIRSRAYANHWMTCSGSYLHVGRPGASLRCLGRGLIARPGSIRQPLGMPLRWIRRRASGNTVPA